MDRNFACLPTRHFIPPTMIMAEKSSKNIIPVINAEESTDTARIMWLDKAEKYVFSCGADSYYSTDEYDFSLKIALVDIASIQTSKHPERDSYDSLDYSGMQVTITYTDGSSVSSNVRSSGSIEAFEWYNTAHSEQSYIAPWISVISIDGTENTTITELTNGPHTAMLHIEKYEYDNNAPGYDFEVNFTVKRGNIETIQVQNPQTDYTEDFGESLAPVQLRVTYNNGTAEKVISSYDGEISQYLRTETIEETSSIDKYLKNGGKVGKATVYVSYRGAQTAYEITIAENPYDKMTITPKRNVYYADCSYPFGDDTYSGDQISSDFSVTLHRRNGKEDHYDNWYDIPYEWRGNHYGISWKDSTYWDIDEFISDGGSIGTQTVTVSCCGLQDSFDITIEENPYDHIKIAAPPSKIKYVHNK